MTTVRRHCIYCAPETWEQLRRRARRAKTGSRPDEMLPETAALCERSASPELLDAFFGETIAGDQAMAGRTQPETTP